MPNVINLGKLIVANGFKSCPKYKKIAQSGHTGHDSEGCFWQINKMLSCY